MISIFVAPVQRASNAILEIVKRFILMVTIYKYSRAYGGFSSWTPVERCPWTQQGPYSGPWSQAATEERCSPLRHLQWRPVLHFVQSLRRNASPYPLSPQRKVWRCHCKILLPWPIGNSKNTDTNQSHAILLVRENFNFKTGLFGNFRGVGSVVADPSPWQSMSCLNLTDL